MKIFNTHIPLGLSSDISPCIEGAVTSKDFELPIQLRNDSIESLSAISHVYLFTDPTTTIVPFKKSEYETSLGVGFSISPIGGPAFYNQPINASTANSLDSQEERLSFLEA